MNASLSATGSFQRRALALERTQSVPLAPDESLTVKHARGVRVRCELGQLWITELGQFQDIVLEAGESTTLSPVRHTMVRAMTRSLVTVDVDARGLRRVGQALWSRLGLFATTMHVRGPATHV